MSDLFKMPTEVVDLPSKGLVYPESSPLSKGQVEMKYMTAREEDILTNISFVRQGIVIDTLLASMIVTPIDYNQLITADREHLMLAARILGYGKDYKFKYTDPETGLTKDITVDLSEVKDKEFDESKYTKGKNEFTYTLPTSGVEVTFKLLTLKDEKDIDAGAKNMKKVAPNKSEEITSRLKKTIIAVNGNRDQKIIAEFVDNHLLAKDSRSLREYIADMSPGVDLTFSYTRDNGEVVEGLQIPITVDFFWPTS